MQVRTYIELMRLHRPIGTVLLAWPTFWALWLATDGMPNPTVIIVFTLGIFLMRSAGCVINDIADRKLDPLVERTRLRPLASGRLKVSQALTLFALLMASAAGLLAFLNPFTRWLAVVGAGLTLVYPFLKRFTHLPQLGLGAAFAWSIPMAFGACQNTLPFAASALFLAAFLWTVMYDTLYAMTDRADDIKAGNHSTAILFGSNDRRMIALLQLSVWMGFAVTGVFFHLNRFFYDGIFVTGLLFIHQSWLIRNREPAACFKAFTHNHWVGLVVFISIVAGLK